jgi:23S rRNA pseudouridine955/2504/2580 synthase
VDDANQRLDKYVRKLLPAFPLSYIFKLIRTEKIKVNRKKSGIKTLLKAGDTVSAFLDDERLAAGIAPEKQKSTRNIKQTAFYKNNLDIIFQDDNLIVLNKHPGTVVHTGSGYEEGSTLLDVLRAYCGPDTFISLAHRLDRDTSGVLVFALRRPVMMEVSLQFRNRETRKLYSALVAGHPTPPAGSINLCLQKVQSGFQHRMRIADPGATASLSALTRYREVKRYQSVSLLEVTPATGRTHQIRVHLASLGCPIAGDELYGEKEWNRSAKEKFGLKRHFLHCQEIELTLSGYSRPLLFQAPLSPDLAAVLAALP